MRTGGLDSLQALGCSKGLFPVQAETDAGRPQSPLRPGERGQRDGHYPRVGPPRLIPSTNLWLSVAAPGFPGSHRVFCNG